MSTVNYIQVTLELWSAVICIFMLLIVFLGKKTTGKYSRWLMILLFANALMLAADSFAYIYRGDVSNLGFFMTRWSNFLVFSTEDIMFIAGIFYLYYLVRENGYKPRSVFLYLAMMCAAISLLLLVMTQFNGFFYSFDSGNHYVRSQGITLNFILVFGGILLESSMFFCYRKQIGKWYFYSLITYYALLLGAILLQYYIYGFSFISLATTLLTWMLFISHEKDHVDKIEKQAEMLIEQEKKLSEGKNKMLLSSIQPHFLFNSLTAIKILIMEDPHRAEQATDDLAVFLRGSIDMLNQSDGMSTLRKEVKVITSYMDMNQIRFGERIQMDILMEDDTPDYQIPSFTIQPLLENAIRHGIRKNKDGCGTIRIHFLEKDDSHEIIVEDDGIGFDTKEIDLFGENHVGIKIVRERLQMLCHGSLSISSEIGKGTICTIVIPKEQA